MTYGDPAWRSWVLPEDAGRPFIKRALELGINFFDTADMYSRGVSEEILGRALKDFATRDDVVARHQGVQPDGRRSERSRAFAQAHHVRHRRARCGASAPTTSTSTRSIASTPTRRSRKRSRRCTTSSAPARRATSARPACSPGSSPRRCYSRTRHGWTRFVSMQNHYNLVYREEEREMIPLCREEGIGVIPWSPLARGFLAGNRQRGDKGATARAKTDDFAHKLYYADSDFRIVDRVVDVAKHARRHAGAGGARVDPAPAGRHRADHRRVEDGAPRSGDCRARHHAQRRRASPARRAVRAAHGEVVGNGQGSGDSEIGTDLLTALVNQLVTFEWPAGSRLVSITAMSFDSAHTLSVRGR